MLLPEGTIYLGTPKHSSVVKVLEQVYCMEREMSSEAAWEAGSPPAGGAAYIPMAEAEGLTPRSDKLSPRQGLFSPKRSHDTMNIVYT